jgi:hypothetical protein
MDPTVARLENSAECEQFAINVAAKFPELALQARRRSFQFQAATHGEVSEVESACLQAIYASEQAIRQTSGKKGIGRRPWTIVKRLGIFPAVEKLAAEASVAKVAASTLIASGLPELTYDAVILRFSESFSTSAVNGARRRSPESSAELAAAE